MARKAQDLGMSVTILSSDKDLLQLVSGGDSPVSMCEPKVAAVREIKKAAQTPERVRDRYGIEPSQIASYLAIIGDKADNIQGVPSIGTVHAFEHAPNVYPNPSHPFSHPT